MSLITNFVIRCWLFLLSFEDHRQIVIDYIHTYVLWSLIIIIVDGIFYWLPLHHYTWRKFYFRAYLARESSEVKKKTRAEGNKNRKSRPRQSAKAATGTRVGGCANSIVTRRYRSVRSICFCDFRAFRDRPTIDRRRIDHSSRVARPCRVRGAHVL